MRAPRERCNIMFNPALQHHPELFGISAGYFEQLQPRAKDIIGVINDPDSPDADAQTVLHGCRWETFCIFAYCDPNPLNC